MLNYIVFAIAIIIFATVIIISGKAISRGIDAKQNMKDKSEDVETFIKTHAKEEIETMLDDETGGNALHVAAANG